MRANGLVDDDTIRTDEAIELAGLEQSILGVERVHHLLLGRRDMLLRRIKARRKSVVERHRVLRANRRKRLT